MTNTKKANLVLERVAAEFAESDRIPEYMAAAYIRAPEIPCSKWSPGNQVLMQFAKPTADARGFRQWMKVGRRVRKGAKASYILCPMVVKREDPEDENKTVSVTVGFKCVPVFAVEDTEGEPLPQYKPAAVPPLANLADIRYANTVRGESGSYDPRTGGITLSTEDPAVYLHELVHKYDAKTHEMKGGQDPEQEIVAELGACVLSRLYGVERSADRSMAYIASYAGAGTPAETGAACLRAADRVMTAIRLIMADAAKTA